MSDDNPTVKYELEFRDTATTRVFTAEEKALLRPIAETIAMLDGNAFFTMDLGDGREWYEQYLPEAWSLFESNGGLKGWASEMQHVRVITSNNPSVIDARRSLNVAVSLSEDEKK